MNLAERFKVMPLLATANIGGSVDCDSVCMEDIQKIMFIISNGIAGGNVTFSVNSGVTDGAKTNAVPFQYAMGGAAIGTAVAGSVASADVLGASAWANNGSVVLTCSTLMVIIEVDPADMTPGDLWLTLTLACASGIAHVNAVAQTRYKANQSITELAR